MEKVHEGTDWTCQSGLWSFMLERPWWTMMLHHQSCRPVEVVDSNQIKTLIENNQHFNMTYFKYPNQVLKVICTRLVMVIILMFGFHVKLSEKNLDYIFACDFLLKSNENVLFLKHILMGNEKWILHNTVEWKRSWSKWNEPYPELVFIQRKCCHVHGGTGRESSIMSSFWKRGQLILTSTAPS